MLEKILACFEFLKTTLIYIVYPPICPVCEEIVDERHQLCESCATKILKLDEAKDFPAPISGVMRITNYRNGTRRLLRALKFDGNTNVLKTLQSTLYGVTRRPEIDNFLAKVNFATFVPLHEKRLKKRGYNQTELIFKDWLLAQNLPAENLLLRTKNTPHLYDLNPQERREVLKGAFTLIEGVDVKGKNILIVDDIFTTGATAAACAEILKSAGAAKIFVMAFASDFGEDKIA
ncbi:MAG: ComF family protein [Selenomonadaceae bacterium]|nr:ComF family protein [Selenomonadaceae bacterium]